MVGLFNLILDGLIVVMAVLFVAMLPLCAMVVYQLYKMVFGGDKW